MDITKLTRVLHLSDCLALLERIPSEQVTLCYFDPPWYTGQQNYSFLQWEGDSRAETTLESYLIYLSHILEQTRRVLAEDGSLFFHSIPSLAGSVRNTLDYIFGAENFREEIVVQRPWRRNDLRSGTPHEVIYVYSKGDHPKIQPAMRRLSELEIDNKFPKIENGRRYRLLTMVRPGRQPHLQYEWNGYTPVGDRAWQVPLSEMKRLHAAGELEQREYGSPVWRKRFFKPDVDAEALIGNLWTEPEMSYIPAPERFEDQTSFRYTAQRPLALMERIIEMGSERGDVILDPFVGSGSTLVAARKLERIWIGGDASEQAVQLARTRLAAAEPTPSNGPKIIEQAHLEERFSPYSINYKDTIASFSDYRPIKDVFYLDQMVPFEETKHCEFKEITGGSPIRTIINDIDNYVTAFLNTTGGRIFWGVSNMGKVTGVKLKKTERDKLRKDIDSKLAAVQPPVDPTLYLVELHEVHNNFQLVPDCVVVEVVVPKAEAFDLYALADGAEALVKTNSGKRKMTVAEIVDWARRRMPKGRLEDQGVEESEEAAAGV
ncbi:MAG: DNA methyltransferase [Armatimonas sp.]